MSAPDESLADLATQALDSIDTLLYAVGGQKKNFSISHADLEVEAQRLRLWATNLNIWHGAHGSLDYRLRDAPTIRQLAQSLLGELVTCLCHLNDIVSGERQPFEHNLAQAAETPPTLPSQNAEAENSDSGTDSSSTDTGESEPGEVEVRWGDLLSIIQKLYKFSTDIRNSSTRAGPGDRPLFPRETVEKQNEFLHQLAELEVRLIDCHLNRCREEAQVALAQVDETSQLQHQRIVSRLGRANVVRRQHFKYWHEQNDKRKGIVPSAFPGGQNALDRRKFIIDRTTPNLPPGGGLSALPARSKIPPSNPTSVTRLNPGKFRPGGTSVYSRASGNSPVQGPIGEEVPWPGIHNLPTRDNYFECPYCSLMCPVSYAKSKSSWRSHVRHDIRPYCCTYPDCESGNLLFDDRKEWSSHEKYIHRKVYKCTEHSEFEFDESGYIEHAENFHTKYFAQLVSLHGLQTAASTTKYVDRKCPLCFTTADSLEAMESHLTYHLECIALLALPRATGLEEDSQKSEAGSASMVRGTDSRNDDIQLADWSNEDAGLESPSQSEPRPEEVHNLSAAALDQYNNKEATFDTTIHNWVLETNSVADDALPELRPLTSGSDVIAANSGRTSPTDAVVGVEKGFVMSENVGVSTLPDEHQTDADLPCPFQVMDCDRTFSEIVQFKMHVFSHFRGYVLPESASCFLCEKKYRQNVQDDPATAWNVMLSHMARDHYRRGQQLATIRTDSDLMQWLYARRLINSRQFKKGQLMPVPILSQPSDGSQVSKLRENIRSLELETEEGEKQALPLDPERADMLAQYRKQLKEALAMEITTNIESNLEGVSPSQEEIYKGTGQGEADAASDEDAELPDRIVIPEDGTHRKDRRLNILFPPRSINEGTALIRDLRQQVAEQLKYEPSQVRLCWSGGYLSSNQDTLRLYGLKKNSQVSVILTKASIDYEQDQDADPQSGFLGFQQLRTTGRPLKRTRRPR